MIPINTPARRNYNNVGTYNNGFEYKIMPLSFNLQQKGNDNLPNELNNRFSFNYGDLVTGTCIYDQEEHQGTIINILYDEKTNKPRIAYILDSYSSMVLPIIYSTLYFSFYESLDVTKPLKENPINNKRNPKEMKILKETYSNSSDQMTDSIKAQEKKQKKRDRLAEANKAFAIGVLGKITYNKYLNKGIFAPMPLSGLKLTLEDFYLLNPANKGIKMLDAEDIEKTKRLVGLFNKLIGKEVYRIIDNGYNYLLQTNTVLKTFDDVIDMLLTIKKAYKTVYRCNDSNCDINWDPIKSKFRKYLN